MGVKVHIDYYGLHLDIMSGVNRIVRIGSAVDAFEFDMAHDFLKGGDKCLVAGGGRGSVATWIAAKLGVENIIVFEVIPDLWRMMSDNIMFDGLPLPYLFWGALGVENKDEGIFVPKLYTGNSVQSLLENHETVLAPITDTNEIIEEYSINSINLDVEGDEFSIIPHINLEPLRVISMEMHGDLERSMKLRNYLEDNGFKTEFWIEHGGLHPAQHITVVRT